MTNKSVMTFISVNKISVCLSVCLYIQQVKAWVSPYCQQVDIALAHVER